MARKWVVGRGQQPVWTALSELFLDSSFDEADHRRIADVLRQSPYRREELQDILRNEVAPVFGTNLYSIAGEWERGGEDEVRQLMERWIETQSARAWRARIWRIIAPRMIPNDWYPIADLLE